MRLIVDQVTGARGGEVLFADVSFTLAKGQGLQITGANGSGKSTLLRIIAGLIAPETGTIKLDDSETDLASTLVYLGHQNAMKPALTVRENLTFWSEFSGGTAQNIATAIDVADLEKLADLPFSYLSAGQKRRTALARLLSAPKPIWLLDEPTAALDTATIKRFAAIMANHQKAGGIVIAATHLPLGMGEFGIEPWQNLEIVTPTYRDAPNVSTQ